MAYLFCETAWLPLIYASGKEKNGKNIFNYYWKDITGNYQEVPAKHVGDFGIEGYSTDGCVFQCYATEEPRSTQERYEAQRNKITTDIGKFIKNKPELSKLFGTTQIKRWILIVPLYDSATLVQHASKKSEEVLRASLPYIANDFKVIIQTDSCFAKEKNELANAGSFDIDIRNTDINLNDRENWITNNQGLIDNLTQKASKIPKLASDNKIEDFKDSMVDHYLRGQNYSALGKSSKACKNWKEAERLGHLEASEMVALNCNWTN